MNEYEVFTPVFTDGLWPLKTIVIPVTGIIVVLLVGKYGGKFIKLLESIKSGMGSMPVQSDRSEYW